MSKYISQDLTQKKQKRRKTNKNIKEKKTAVNTAIFLYNCKPKVLKIEVFSF